MFDFLKKKQNAEGKPEKLPGPKELPDDVGGYLVTKMNQNPDWVWNLKAVLKPDKEKGCYFVKVFDGNQVYSQGHKVRDYHFFDAHPDLALYEGWFNKNTHVVKLETRKQAA